MNTNTTPRVVWGRLQVVVTRALLVSALFASAITSRAHALQATTDSLSVAPTSPRASVANFIRYAEAEDWENADDYLILTASQRPRAAELARRLKYVLDQRVILHLDNISPFAIGDTTDGDRDGDRIGTLVGPSGEANIRMVRAADVVPQRWQFSSQTVALADLLYDAPSASWIRGRVPPSLMREGPFHLFLWQWIGLIIAIPVLFIIAWLISQSLRSILMRVLVRTRNELDDQVVNGLRGPFQLWIAALALPPLVTFLELNATVSLFIDALSRGLVLIALFWAILRSIRIVQKRLESEAFQHGQVQARTLIPLLGNFLRITLAAIALLVALSQFGYPVGTILAGLGIGGIALALAAQKTVENLFGSVSLAADKAFRVGDWVRAGDTQGAIERIGLRSTSFRTNDRTVVRVPNGKLAEERIETFGERDRMYIKADLDLTYETSPDTLQAIRDSIEATLRAHPKMWQDAVRVHVSAFTDSAIRMTVLCWLQTTNYDEFLNIRHQLWLEFIRIVERHGSGFAYPTRTLHLAVQNPPPVFAVARSSASDGTMTGQSG